MDWCHGKIHGFPVKIFPLTNPLKGSFPPCRRGSRPHHRKRTARCAAPATARREVRLGRWTDGGFTAKNAGFTGISGGFTGKNAGFISKIRWLIFDPQTVSNSWFATRTWRCFMGKTDETWVSRSCMSRISGLTLVNGKLRGLMLCRFEPGIN